MYWNKSTTVDRLAIEWITLKRYGYSKLLSIYSLTIEGQAESKETIAGERNQASFPAAHRLFYDKTQRLDYKHLPLVSTPLRISNVIF